MTSYTMPMTGKFRCAHIVKAIVATGLIASTACKDLAPTPGLPAGTPDPAYYQTRDGALGLRAAAVFQMSTAIPKYLVDVGLLSDELIDSDNRSTLASEPGNDAGISNPLDERILPEGISGGADGLDGSQSYAYLQNVRGAANVALGALAAYDTNPADRTQQRTMRGELFALQGYAEILLADLFCSGVPLSTLDFEHDFTYAPSSSTAQIYADANVKLDSALALAAGTDSIANLSRVLKGRAYLALGNYAAAADDVSTVPMTFQYRMTIQLDRLSAVAQGNFQEGTVADREGDNGLPFLSSGDPRVATMVTCTPYDYRCPVHTLTMPAKYFEHANSNGYAPFVVADGIEARLIEAEAALRSNPNGTQWLTILNTLRTSGETTVSAQTFLDTLGVTQCGGSYGICGAALGIDGSDPAYGQPDGGFPGFTVTATTVYTPAHNYVAPDGGNVQDYCYNNSWYSSCYYGDSMVVLTLTRPASAGWNAGTGGVDGLAPLTDSGATLTGSAAGAARIAELFNERAYWLFMTGHRQGDLRRLIRQYGTQYTQFRSDQVYPSGVYTAPGTGLYGSDVNAPVPKTEYANPNYHGCINRNA